MSGVGKSKSYSIKIRGDSSEGCKPESESKSLICERG